MRNEILINDLLKRLALTSLEIKASLLLDDLEK